MGSRPSDPEAARAALRVRDEFGAEVITHLADRPVLIFNLIGERERGEKRISDNAGAISLHCGVLADENLRQMGGKAPEEMDALEEDLYQACEELIDEIMEIRNEDLRKDFKQ